MAMMRKQFNAFVRWQAWVRSGYQNSQQVTHQRNRNTQSQQTRLLNRVRDAFNMKQHWAFSRWLAFVRHGYKNRQSNALKREDLL
jgi:hypothetical protein